MAQRLEAHHGWKGDKAGYHAQLHRVRRARGRAKEHLCVKHAEKGKQVRANDWAHVHGESGFDVYADFVPLCDPCHEEYDNPTKARGARVQLAAGKLAEQDVIRIRELLAKKVPQQRIATEFGVVQTAISKINTGRTYANVGRTEGSG